MNGLVIGQALLDTLHGAAQLVKQLDDARFVVWLNPFWGPIADVGKSFEQMKIYQDAWISMSSSRGRPVSLVPKVSLTLAPLDISLTKKLQK